MRRVIFNPKIIPISCIILPASSPDDVSNWSRSYYMRFTRNTISRTTTTRTKTPLITFSFKIRFTLRVTGQVIANTAATVLHRAHRRIYTSSLTGTRSTVCSLPHYEPDFQSPYKTCARSHRLHLKNTPKIQSMARRARHRSGWRYPLELGLEVIEGMLEGIADFFHLRDHIFPGILSGVLQIIQLGARLA